MTDILFALPCVALAAYGLHLRRKRLARPCVLDPIDKIEWFAQQRRDRQPTEISPDSVVRQWRHRTHATESRHRGTCLLIIALRARVGGSSTGGRARDGQL
jgi:hypothetical protein